LTLYRVEHSRRLIHTRRQLQTLRGMEAFDLVDLASHSGQFRHQEIQIFASLDLTAEPVDQGSHSGALSRRQ
jgi:hypothetical protein